MWRKSGAGGIVPSGGQDNIKHWRSPIVPPCSLRIWCGWHGYRYLHTLVVHAEGGDRVCLAWHRDRGFCQVYPKNYCEYRSARRPTPCASRVRREQRRVAAMICHGLAASFATSPRPVLLGLLVVVFVSEHYLLLGRGSRVIIVLKENTKLCFAPNFGWSTSTRTPANRPRLVRPRSGTLLGFPPCQFCRSCRRRSSPRFSRPSRHVASVFP